MASVTEPTTNTCLKRPRGRPPTGAILTTDGTYELPPEAIEAAAERVIKHRIACRERYVATRAGLRKAKPTLFKPLYKPNQTLDGGIPANMG
jgi:hypothetical protein